MNLSVSHPSHSPWKPPQNGGSHITHRTTTSYINKDLYCHF